MVVIVLSPSKVEERMVVMVYPFVRLNYRRTVIGCRIVVAIQITRLFEFGDQRRQFCLAVFFQRPSRAHSPAGGPAHS